MIKQHPWIATERQFFGRPHTEYDFKSKNVHESKKKLKELQNEQVSLSKKINKKVKPFLNN